MAGNNIWKGADTDNVWTNVGNWTAAAAPVADDDLFFVSGSSTIDTNLPASGSGLNYDTITVQPNFAGKIGTATNKLYLGTIDEFTFYGDRCQECWIGVDAADVITLMYVDGTSPNPNAMHIFSGTVTSLHVRRSQMVRIGAGSTVTNLYVGPGAHVLIEASATVTNVYMSGGVVNCLAAVATLLRISGSAWIHEGTTTYNIATLDIYGGMFRFNSKGGTITTANLFGGELNASGGYGDPRTITTCNRYLASRLDLSGTGSSVTIGTENIYGGTKSVGAPPAL